MRRGKGWVVERSVKRLQGEEDVRCLGCWRRARFTF